jgi:hypothetical protein
MPELVAEARFCQQCKFFARRGTALMCLHPNRIACERIRRAQEQGTLDYMKPLEIQRLYGDKSKK